MSPMRILKDERGSSSIFIVIILLCLLTFGVLSLMSSYADLKLARKSENWVNTYYILDNQGALLVSDVDHCLQTARENTQLYKQTGMVPDHLDGDQIRIRPFLARLGPAGSTDQIYFLFAWQALNLAGYQTMPETPEEIMELHDMDQHSLIMQETFHAVSGSATHNLTVTLGVIPWSGQQTKRYDILEWLQWQDQIQVPGDGIKIWPGY